MEQPFAFSHNVLKVAYLVLIGKIKIADNQMINSYLGCPRQDSNLHVSQHSHLKRARLPFRHLGYLRCKGKMFISIMQVL